MRILNYFLIGVAALCLAGYSYLRRMAIDPKGTTIAQSISLVLVRRNPYQIADAEHEQVTSYSECFSLEQLISMGKVDPDAEQRRGYTFSISCDDDGARFTVMASHAPAPPDSPLRWPVLVVDQSMTLHENF